MRIREGSKARQTEAFAKSMTLTASDEKSGDPDIGERGVELVLTVAEVALAVVETAAASPMVDKNVH